MLNENVNRVYGTIIVCVCQQPTAKTRQSQLLEPNAVHDDKGRSKKTVFWRVQKDTLRGERRGFPHK